MFKWICLCSSATSFFANLSYSFKKIFISSCNLNNILKSNSTSSSSVSVTFSNSYLNLSNNSLKFKPKYSIENFSIPSCSLTKLAASFKGTFWSFNTLTFILLISAYFSSSVKPSKLIFCLFNSSWKFSSTFFSNSNSSAWLSNIS